MADNSFQSDEDVIPSPTPSPPRSITKESKTKIRTVIVEGNIGCGKTTFLNFFRQFKQVQIHPEPVSKWTNFDGFNALNHLYTDTKRWCFAFEAMASLTMLDHHKLGTEQKVKMLERSMYSARYCFAENFHQEGKMADVDYAILNEMFSYLVGNENIGVDLIVYLRASPEVCYKRLQQRNRMEEAGVPLDYLRKLHNLHDEWLIHGKRGKCNAPVLGQYDHQMPIKYADSALFDATQTPKSYSAAFDFYERKIRVLDVDKDIDAVRRDIENFKHEIVGCFD